MPRKTFTDDQIRSALKEGGGKAEAAAKLLGCSPLTVYSRAKKLGIQCSLKTKPRKNRAAKVEDGALWAAYKAGNAEAANALAVKHLPLARSLVYRLKTDVPIVDLDDMFSAALDGLLRAMQGFDPDRGIKFSTYAAARIYGAMLDELRRLDLMPRSTRKLERQREIARQYLTQEYGRGPTDDELFDAVGWSPEDVRKARFMTVCSLDQVRYETESGRKVKAVDLFAATSERDHRMVETIEHMTRGVSLEPRIVMYAYFAIGHTMKEIGTFLALSESRVSQLMTAALAELRRNQELVDEYRKRISAHGHQTQQDDPSTNRGPDR